MNSEVILVAVSIAFGLGHRSVLDDRTNDPHLPQLQLHYEQQELTVSIQSKTSIHIRT